MRRNLIICCSSRAAEHYVAHGTVHITLHGPHCHPESRDEQIFARESMKHSLVPTQRIYKTETCSAAVWPPYISCLGR